MLVIGLVGGIASGKSYVAEQFQRLGAEVINADRVGHAVLDEEEVKAALRERWGEAIFDEDQRVNRRSVAEIVFANPPDGPRELAFLEQITHPRIGKGIKEKLEWLSGQGARCVILDAPVLLEAGWKEYCDHILFVEASLETRRSRALDRGWKPADFDAREAAQVGLAEKRAQSNFVIQNDHSPEETRQQIQQFWNSLELS